MLDSALDRGMSLTAISTLPPESPSGSVLNEQFQSDRYANRTSYDSIFEKTEHRISIYSSNSAFFDMDSSHVPPQFRLLSSFSITSVHSLLKEDVTMISVSSLACGFDTITHFLYRRCLVAATFDAVP
jgi:serine/arginine repetitive matrix protein 2